MDLTVAVTYSNSVVTVRGEDNPTVTVQNEPSVVRVVQSASPLPVTGAGGSDFEFTQGSPLVQWVVNHNLGRKPVITILSVGGLEVEASVLHTSINQVVVDFDVATAGTLLAR